MYQNNRPLRSTVNYFKGSESLSSLHGLSGLSVQGPVGSGKNPASVSVLLPDVADFSSKLATVIQCLVLHLLKDRLVEFLPTLMND